MIQAELKWNDTRISNALVSLYYMKTQTCAYIFGIGALITRWIMLD